MGNIIHMSCEDICKVQCDWLQSARTTWPSQKGRSWGENGLYSILTALAWLCNCKAFWRFNYCSEAFFRCPSPRKLTLFSLLAAMRLISETVRSSFRMARLVVMAIFIATALSLGATLLVTLNLALSRLLHVFELAFNFARLFWTFFLSVKWSHRALFANSS